ncbi:hypothetical protein GOBAR_AA07906 [Gossypium barbadense]|uniref:Uncharacterized protein n=1 Tax=Gossypium barbadense TaxID=3634 RepID=A0A2P5YAW5_GOSBA|nr:hypothetical protein GOBAR_AA07906 [Gossypium barbadense]
MDGWWLRRWVLMMWRDIISNVLWVLLLSVLDEAVLRREPKVPSPSSHIRPDRDDPSPMSLRLMEDGEGDEVGKVEDVPVRHAPQEIGVVSVDDASALSLSRQSVGQDGVPSAIPNSGTLNWHTKPSRQNWTVPGSSKFVMTTWRWKVEQSSIVSSSAAQSMQWPTPRGRAYNILNSSSWGPKGNRRNGCLISMIGPENDAASFLFFVAGTTVFLLCEVDIVNL